MILRPYQQQAVEAITTGLADGCRGQLVAACGTGKTLIATEVATRLSPAGVTIVACPSVALIAQTIRTWTDAAPGVPVLAVCFDDTVVDPAATVADLPAVATTDAARVEAWLAATSGRRLIATTHVSADVVGAALRRAGLAADLLIVDEAHHTAGAADKHGALVHDDTRLPARRRLYATATPRILASGRGEGADVISMDDQAVFGPALFEYRFATAIADGWLDDYQVAVVGVRGADVLATLRAIDRQAIADVYAPPLRTAVVQAALAKAAERFDLRRVIAFCPRVALAQEFATTLPATIGLLDPESRPRRPVTAGHVAGTMNVAQREYRMRQLRTPPDDGWTVLANARCLSEGVDVPAVDGVLFTHPKRSVVDVVQAVGRALRHNPDGSGTSTVIVPLLLPDDPTAAVDEDDEEYQVLWQVIRALRAHDETLAADLDRQRSHFALRGGGEPLQRVLAVLPDGYDTDHYLANLTIRIVRQTTSLWWEGVGQARAYHAEHGHLLVPATYRTQQGYPLGRWIARQRNYRPRLAPNRIQALDEVGMVWRVRSGWDEGLAAAREHHQTHGHLRLSARAVTDSGYRLGRWLAKRRSDYREGTLSPEQIRELESLGMQWESEVDQRWQEGLEHLTAYRDEHGHCAVPKGHVCADGFPLGTWLATKRTNHTAGNLPQHRLDELARIGVRWGDWHWQRGVAAARRYHADHGHLRPTKNTCGYAVSLPQWLAKRRQDYQAGRLSPEQIRELEALGMQW